VTDEQRIRELVRRVVYRTVGRAEPTAANAAPARGWSPSGMSRRCRPAACCGWPRRAPDATRPAGSARARVRLDEAAAAPQATGACDDGPEVAAVERTVAVGADHGGVALKAELTGLLGSLGYRWSTAAPAARSRWTIRTSRTRWRSWWRGAARAAAS